MSLGGALLTPIYTEGKINNLVVTQAQSVHLKCAASRPDSAVSHPVFAVQSGHVSNKEGAD